MNIFLHERLATDGCPSGITISKKPFLPEGDFSITEYSWGDCKLWFVDADNFTADERQAAYLSYITGGAVYAR